MRATRRDDQNIKKMIDQWFQATDQIIRRLDDKGEHAVMIFAGKVVLDMMMRDGLGGYRSSINGED
ncbi:MAG: hypothetical protein WED34_04840 [Planctomycetales bacterium]